MSENAGPQDDFILLTEAHAVSPNLKVAVRLGRLNMEMNGAQEVKIEYDPQIDTSHLMMQESASPFYIPPLRELGLNPLIPFFSSERVEVVWLVFSSRVEGETLVFLCNYDDRSARQAIEAVKRLPIPAAKENPAALLRLILQTIGRLRAWPNAVPGLNVPCRIEIRIASKFMEALERASGLTLPMAVPGECLIAQWEVGQ